MKNRTHKIPIFFLIILTAMLLTACGEDPDLARFRKNMDDFCTKISEIDSSINNIDAQSENAVSELLGYLDELDATFKDFAALDFPEEFDYLEGRCPAIMRHTATAPTMNTLPSMPDKIIPDPISGFRSSSLSCTGRSRMMPT